MRTAVREGMNLLRRAELVVRRDATLGTIMSELAAVHGHRRLVEEAEGGLRISYRQAEKRVNRWAGGIASKVEPGDRVVIATPNSYEMFLLAMAASRAGAIPVPLNDRMRPRRDRPRRSRLRFRAHRCAAQPRSTASSPWAKRCRRTPTTSARCSTRRARRASRRAPSSRIAPSSATSPRQRRGLLGCIATRPSSACRSRTSWVSSC